MGECFELNEDQLIKVGKVGTEMVRPAGFGKTRDW